MSVIDSVILANVNRADSFASLAADATAAISSSRGNVHINPYPLTVEKSDLTARLERPDVDTTPMPVYIDPAVAMPTAPTLKELRSIDSPILPATPTLNTTGLFEQVAPSSNMPDWTEGNLVLHVDEIYNELIALAQPIMTEVEIPGITSFTISTPPELLLPSYEEYATPESIPASSDYAAYMDAKYKSALPEMQAFIDDKTDGWIAKYAPELEEQRSLFHAKLVSALNNQVLPDQFETALQTRARARIEEEYIRAEQEILENATKRGFIVPAGSTVGGLARARLERAKSLSNNSTEIYLERRKTEIQHLQFVLGLTAQQINAIRGITVQLAQNALQAISQANSLADAITAKLLVRFEHERSRREFSVTILRALNEKFDVKLKAALSGLEGFKLELQALELQSNVEFKQIEAAKAQISAQQQLIDRYTAISDSIIKRLAVDDARVKEFSVKADVFRTNIEARLAAFEAYKAAIGGDEAKLKGELAKLELYEKQLQGSQMLMDSQAKMLDADVKTNSARLGQFGGELDAYKTASSIALQRFTAQAEIKKMGLDIYKTNLQANIAIYEGELKLDTAWMETQIQAFRANTDSWLGAMKLEEAYAELSAQKAIAIASGYSNIAASSSSSTQGMAQIATQE